MSVPTFVPTATVRCECGDIFEISLRSYRRHRSQGTRWRCVICLRRRRAQILAASPRFTNYWLERYSPEWIIETGQMIWGEH